MAVSNRIRAALTTTVLTTAATGFMAGCGVGGGEEEDEQVAYCTDENGEIVDDDFCDDGYSGRRGLFFLYLGGFRPGLPVGTRLPAAAPGSTRGTAPPASAPVCRPPARSAGGHAGQRRDRQRLGGRGGHRRAGELSAR